MVSPNCNIISEMENKNKKTLKTLLKNIFTGKKSKEKPKENVVNQEDRTKEDAKAKISSVDAVIAAVEKLKIENNEFENFTVNEVPVPDDDDTQNFEFIEPEERKTERTDSQTSEESGFYDGREDGENDVIEIKDDDEDKDKNGEEKAKIEEEKDKNDDENDKNDEEKAPKHDDKNEKDDTDEVSESLGNLKIEEGSKKANRVPLARGPIKTPRTNHQSPYDIETYNNLRQVNHTVNRQTFSGGQMLSIPQEFQEVPYILPSSHEDQVVSSSLDLLDSQEFDLVQQFIADDLNKSNHDNIINSYQVAMPQDTYEQIVNVQTNTITTAIEYGIDDLTNMNPIEEMENVNHVHYQHVSELDSAIATTTVDDYYDHGYPTPPGLEYSLTGSPSAEPFYSNSGSSPSYASCSPHSNTSVFGTSDIMFTPNSDADRYQDLPSIPELPETIQQITPDPKGRERKESESKLNLKKFKDMQKEIAGAFEKFDRSLLTRKSCKEFFDNNAAQVDQKHRLFMCAKIAEYNFETMKNVLVMILSDFSGTKDEGCSEAVRKETPVPVNMFAFTQIANKMLGTPEMSAEFLGEHGLELLIRAALICPKYPELTRYLVCCVRKASKCHPDLIKGRDCIFKEDGMKGTLLSECARRGDTYAAVLTELLVRERDELPLFDITLLNSEGYSALHVACKWHRPTAPCLHVVHLLLEHGADESNPRTTKHNIIKTFDTKGGDTALHMAMSSQNCDLKLVLLLFYHITKKDWHAFANLPNRSQKNPRQYATEALKTRTSYPVEVLEFLKKCRKPPPPESLKQDL